MRPKIALLYVCALIAASLGCVYNMLRAQTPTRPRVVSRNTGASNNRSTLSAPTFAPPEIKAELVAYPDAKVAFICGPQLKTNSQLNPYPWFDSTQIRNGHIQGKDAPAIPPRILTGTVSVNRQSRVLTGNGTRFRLEV